MSTTYTLDTATSRANPTPAPLKRLTVPAIRKSKGGTPLAMLTAYTVRTAQLLDPHCDMLLVGDSLGQVIYGLPSTVPVTLEMMAAHGAAVVRGSYHAVVIVDMPFGSYEASPAKAFESAAWLLKQTGAAGVKLEGGQAMAPTVRFLSERGIPVMGHVGLTPQSVNALGGYSARGRTVEEAQRIIDDAAAIAEAGAFALVIEGVVEPIAVEITRAVEVPTIGIGASAQCDGQVLVAEDMLGLFERVPRFVKRFDDLAGRISAAAETYAGEVRARTFPTADQTYAPKKLTRFRFGDGAAKARPFTDLPEPVLALTPANNEAFFREVDEELRRDRAARLWKQWGVWIAAAVIAGLAAFGGWIYWQHHQTETAGAQGEQLQVAYDALAAGNPKVADAPLATLKQSGGDGYRALAAFTQADILLQKNDAKGAASKFAGVAGDASLAQPFRDLALIRQSSAEFDTVKPEVIVDRLRPLAAPGGAWLGSAGELLGAAYLKMGKRAQAGQVFGRISRDKDVPESIRQRAVQLASALGDSNRGSTK